MRERDRESVYAYVSARVRVSVCARVCMYAYSACGSLCVCVWGGGASVCLCH